LRNKGEFAPSPTSEKDANSTRFGLNRAKGIKIVTIAKSILSDQLINLFITKVNRPTT
jgi:hypothetical protein